MSVWFFDTFEYGILSLANSRLIEMDQILKQYFANTSCFDGNDDRAIYLGKTDD